MAYGRFSSVITGGWMDDIAAMDKWMALVSADPESVGDPLTVEIIGGVYARQEAEWERTGPRSLLLDSGLVWRSLVPGTVVAGVACFDAEFNGELIASDLLDEPLVLTAGGNFLLPAGHFMLAIDV